MLKNPVLPPDFKKELRCMQCQKAITDGYYGRYLKPDGTDGGVCSKACSILLLYERVAKENERSTP